MKGRSRPGRAPGARSRRGILLLLALLLPGCLPGYRADALPGGEGTDGTGEDPLLVHFLDVGQGSAVLLQDPEGRTVLLDAGPGARIVDALRPLGVERLDLFVVSHNHADHIGGGPAVLRAFPVRFFMDNGLPHTTATYERLLDALEETDVPLLDPERRAIGLGKGSLEILPPPGDPSLGHNDNSLGLLLVWGAFRAFFPGDAEPHLWDFWIRTYPEFLGPVRIHKAAHHGSRNGDVPEAMEPLRPGLVVVSAGRNNRYGHPHEEALALYRAVGARVLTTGECGTVTVTAQRDGSFRATSERCAPLEG